MLAATHTPHQCVSISNEHQSQLSTIQRRNLLTCALSTLSVMVGITPPATASKLPEMADKAWEAIGGGPADLIYPESFLGVWNVESILERIDLPLGPEAVKDMSVIQRAAQQDKDRIVRYQASFIRNTRGHVVTDRRFNTASLMQTYLGVPLTTVLDCIEWNPSDPNSLAMTLPNGMQVTTRVTKRMEEWAAGADRLATSEFFQQFIERQQQQRREQEAFGTVGRANSKIKATQAYTKYHWRPSSSVGSGVGPPVPEIVATQVVSDYDLMMGNGVGGESSKPVTIWTYRMGFYRVA